MLQLHLSDQQFYCLLRYDLCYILNGNKKMNYLWFFHNPVTFHMGPIWLHNQLLEPLKFSHKNTELHVSHLKYLVWRDQSVTNCNDSMKTSFPSHNFHHDACRNHWSSAYLGYLLVKMALPIDWVSNDGVIFLFLLKEIQLHLMYKGSQQGWM